MISRQFILAILMLLSTGTIAARQKSNSAALKSYHAPEAPSLVRPYDETERLWQDFQLVRNANGGDAESQHELGLRYLFGEGFIADTVKAAHWIASAANQHLPTACFNYGILQNNGWGTAWNPFAAYTNFRFAAERHVPEAGYALGLALLDNLAIPRDESEALCWIRTSADTGYAPAVSLFAELEKRKIGTHPGDRSQSKNGNLGLIFLDFSQDTSVHVSDEMLVDDLAASSADSAQLAASAPPSPSSVAKLDTPAVRSLQTLAGSGSPEALALIGRWQEERTGGDVVAATLDYERAVRLDSPRAPELLWNLTQTKGYFEKLRAAADRGNADATVAWASLVALGFDHQLTDEQAFEFLRTAAEAHHPQAMIELGLCYLTGRWVKQDKAKGMEWWKRAADEGSEEAAVRLISTSLLSPDLAAPPPEEIGRLREAVRLGSVQAELALAYAQETGRGVAQDIPSAVRTYRTIAQRGNRVAYASLRRMYDRIRPKGKEFEVFP